MSSLGGGVSDDCPARDAKHLETEYRMSIWKQSALTFALLVAAFFGWLQFYPGSTETLAKLGIRNVPFAPEAGPAPSAGGQAGAGGNRGGGFGGQQSSVVAQPVLELTINDRLTAIGTGRAVRSVIVTPFASGRLTEVLVESGATVEQGQVIARLDSQAEQIAYDRAQVAMQDAQARVERFQALRNSNAATAVQLTDAEVQLDNARLALRDAELALERRSIEAPIGGVVGILPITAGNYVTSQTEIATIDDRSEILVDFWVPERFASMITVGSSLTAASVARPGEVFDGNVSAVDNRIETDSRTLRVQARLPNESDRLRAGMAFEVGMRFPGDTFPAVDPLAVQWGTDGAYVWAIRGGRAERIPVRIIQRNTDSVLVDASLTLQDTVVTEGLHAVREGAEVRIAGRAGETAANPAAAGGS
ncbi:MAG: efflux RND transporter periplasmic adaptor subunit [Mesorhizobium sp.]